VSVRLPFPRHGQHRWVERLRVHFLLPSAPFGGMAEQTLVHASQCIPLPDGLSDVTAAAIAIPGMSSWAALIERAKLVAGGHRYPARRHPHLQRTESPQELQCVPDARDLVTWLRQQSR
jgi:hypothetical protein